MGGELGFNPTDGGLTGVGSGLREGVARGEAAGEVGDDDAESVGVGTGFNDDGVMHDKRGAVRFESDNDKCRVAPG